LVADVLQMPYLVMWGRGLQGLWTGGQQSVEQAYLAFAAFPGERTELTSRLGTFAVLGFILGPAFGAMFTTVDFKFGELIVDQYTAPGIFILFVGLAMFIATANFFSPSSTSGREKVGSSSGVNLAGDVEKGEAGKVMTEKPSATAVTALLLIFFIHFYSFAVQETITTPLVLNLYDFEQYQVNILFIAVGILSLFTSAAVGVISRYVSDRSMLILSLILGLIGSVLLIDDKENFLPLPRFFLGFGIITVAFPFGRNVTISIFSAVLGEVEQGFYMGLMLAVGAIPRALGPFWAILSLQLASGEGGRYHTWLEFMTSSTLFCLSLIVVVVSYKTLVPFEEYFGVEGGGGEGRETQSLLRTPEEIRKRPDAVSSSKRLSTRRSSFRPAIVSQLQGEFPSDSNLLSSSLLGSSSKESGAGWGGRGKKEGSDGYGAL
jgi:hypothetical protein